jgi:hypothetical protein
MNEYLPRDDKMKEVIVRLIFFAILYLIANFFSDGFTFVEGMIIWLFTGTHYDTTVILNNQRHMENRL